jgi:glutamate dehydrogenase
VNRRSLRKDAIMRSKFGLALLVTTLARIHFTIRTTPGQVPEVDRDELERRLTEAARRWDDDLRTALIDAEGEAGGLALYKLWGGAFPAAYRDRIAARSAVPDVRRRLRAPTRCHVLAVRRRKARTP